MPNPNSVSADQIDSYDFGDAVAPEGFDPNARGYTDPSPGRHMFVITNFSLTPNKTYNFKDHGPWTGYELEIRLEIPAGQPEEGASLFDRLPIPTANTPTPRSMANRWGNFLRSIGFPCPVDRLVPPGFNIHQLRNARTVADVHEDEYNGQKRMKVKMFGYSPVGEASGDNGANKANGKPATRPAAVAAPATGVDLSDL